jgi:oligosaccharide repeat unit polymerase
MASNVNNLQPGRRPRITLHTQTITLLFVYCVLVLSAFFAVDLESSQYVNVRSVLFALIGIGSVACVFHFVSQKRVNWLRLDTVYVVCFFVVAYQWPLMNLISGYLPQWQLESQLLEKHGAKAAFLSTVSLVAWLAGFALPRRISRYSQISQLRGGRIIGALLVLSIIVFSALAGEEFFSRQIYKQETVGLFQTVNGYAAYVLDILETLERVAISYLIYEMNVLNGALSHRRKLTTTRGILIAALAAFVLVFLLGGERGQVLMVGLAAGFGYSYLVKPVRFWQFLLVTFLGFVVFSLIAVFRVSFDVSGVSLLSDYGYWGYSINLAQSFVTLPLAIEMVSSNPEYSYSGLWVSQTLGVVPLLQGFYLEAANLTVAETSSAMAITVFALGQSPTTGLGTSFVADLYLVGGTWGVLLFSAVFGNICSRADHWLNGEHGFLRFNAAIVIGSLIVYMPRSSILFLMKPILWSSVLSIIVQMRKGRVWNSSSSGMVLTVNETARL